MPVRPDGNTYYIGIDPAIGTDETAYATKYRGKWYIGARYTMKLVGEEKAVPRKRDYNIRETHDGKR